MFKWSVVIATPVLMLAACGDNAETPGDTGETEATAPAIATDMESPVDTPFCYFTAAEADTPLTGPEARYVFVTDTGASVYHGYAKLNGEVTELNEVEAGFGANMETRRYFSEDKQVELEVLLVDETGGEAAAGDTIPYSGSVRVTYPAEGEAVKVRGACRAEAEPQ
ncbi:hypothetical protein [Henriciella aquimarina]|uniref:hypothetical protein n=1 Tax=Henriciella aquimarina TaxID=545261 RepID=UPI000A028A15|nr:hypothetical protein [Henriciella aquimarina]